MIECPLVSGSHRGIRAHLFIGGLLNTHLERLGSLAVLLRRRDQQTLSFELFTILDMLVRLHQIQ